MPGQSARQSHRRFASIDGLLLLTFIWGANFSVVKFAIGEIPPLGFNLLRLCFATALFAALLASGDG